MFFSAATATAATAATAAPPRAAAAAPPQAAPSAQPPPQAPLAKDPSVAQALQMMVQRQAQTEKLLEAMYSQLGQTTSCQVDIQKQLGPCQQMYNMQMQQFQQGPMGFPAAQVQQQPGAGSGAFQIPVAAQSEGVGFPPMPPPAQPPQQQVDPAPAAALAAPAAAGGSGGFPTAQERADMEAAAAARPCEGMPTPLPRSATPPDMASTVPTSQSAGDPKTPQRRPTGGSHLPSRWRARR